MKKVLFTLFVAVNISIHAQNITLHNVNGTNIGNSSVTISDLETYHVHVTNNSQAVMPVKVRIKEINQPAGTNVEFCWSACLNDPRPGFEFDTIQIAPGATNTNSFHIMYYANQVNQPASFVVLFFSAENPADSAQVTFNYNPADIQYEENIFIHIYPNPAKDQLFIESLSLETESFVFTAEGKKVMQSNNNPVNIKSLSVGIYFVQIKTGCKTFRNKFVKTE